MASKKPARASVPRLNLPIFLIALFGVLVVVHLWIQVERGFTHGCLGFSAPTGAIAECAEVVGSAFGQVGGFSNVWLGLVFYLLLAGLRAGIALTRPPTSQKLRRASFGVVGVGLLYAAYLIGVQLFVLNRVCVLCLISAATTITLFGLHVVEWRQSRQVAKQAEPAVKHAVSFRPYGLALGVLAVLVVADVVFLSDGADAAAPTQTVAAADPDNPFRPTADQLAAACRFDPQIGTVRTFDLLTSGRAAYQGAEDADVRVLKVFDPNCPHCATLHHVLDDVIPQHLDDARWYYQPIAIWDHSVPQVQAMYIAREHGHDAFIAMMDRQLEGQRRGGIPRDTLVAYAEAIGLAPEPFRRDLEAGKYVELIRQEYALVTGSGLTSVPKLVVEGQVIQNTQATWTPECIEYFVAQASARR